MSLHPGLLKTTLDGRLLGYALRTNQFYTRGYGVVPRVARPSFWQSLIPKPFRHTQRLTDITPVRKTSQPKPWNPATFFIIIFLIIGSNSINLLAVKNDALSFSRQADARIAALKEAIEKVQRGEDVDVKKLLGTGDPIAEQEWEDVLRELRQERPLSENKKNKKSGSLADKDVDNTQKVVSDEEKKWKQLSRDGQTPGKVDFY